jgi:hypothetical protein
MPHNLIERASAAQAAIDKFVFKPFVWGENDCAHLVAESLKALGHTTPLDGLTYTNEFGAKRALMSLGFETLEDVLDSMGFARIPPAFVLPADIVTVPGVGGWNALALVIGDDRLIGFVNDQADWFPLSVATTAWRVA